MQSLRSKGSRRILLSKIQHLFIAKDRQIKGRCKKKSTKGWSKCSTTPARLARGRCRNLGAAKKGCRGLKRLRASKQRFRPPHGKLEWPWTRLWFHTSTGPSQRPCLGQGRGRRIYIYIYFFIYSCISLFIYIYIYHGDLSGHGYPIHLFDLVSIDCGYSSALGSLAKFGSWGTGCRAISRNRSRTTCCIV